MEEDKIPSSDRDQKSTYSQLVDKKISSLLEIYLSYVVYS